NATQRPWYKEAEKHPDKIAWTDVYIFRTSKTPGISASIPLDKQGKRLGVISIDFELRQISDYLKELMEKRREGVIFLINENNELIASNLFNSNNSDGPNQTTGLKLKKLGELDNVYLKFVEQTLQAYKLSIQAIANSQNTQTQYIYRDPNTNDRYYISLSPLQYPESFKAQNTNYPKWVVGTVIPESYYVAEINENKRRLFYIVVGFLVLAGGLAIWIADRVFVQPILAIAKAAQAIEAEQFEAVNLQSVIQRQDELGHLASVFETMSHQVYSREQQLKEQLQALTIEIDQSKYQKDVQDIVESEFFQRLSDKAPLHRQQIHDTLEESSPHTKIISVHSYRGGTGKSNLTANIAVNLAQYGYRVGIIDTDLPSPGIHVLFGFQSEDIDPSLNDYLWGRCEIEQVAHDVTDRLKEQKTERSRLYLIPSSVRTAEISKILREGYNVDTLRDGIKSLIVTLALDYLLIDTHPGINEETLLSITLSHLLILILRPDQQDFQGTAVTVDVARKLAIPKLLSVVNKSPSSFDFEQLRQKVESTYNIEVASILPHSDKMMLFGSEGLFVVNYPDDLLTQKVEDITQKIINL
ncbi:MAG: P-loop NTPase, partial [Snowella sp.]|nr:P-loop NTPase [Snowella sp.]